jgi:hypothetical protein
MVPLFPAKSSWSTAPDRRYVIVSWPAVYGQYTSHKHIFCGHVRTSVWVVRETCAWWNGKVVEHEERREVAKLRGTHTPPYFGSCAFRLLNSKEGLCDLAGRIGCEGLVGNDGQSAEHGRHVFGGIVEGLRSLCEGCDVFQ